MKQIVLLSLAAAVLGGCASPQERLDKGQATAVEAATNRGRFEIGCPEATGQVLSRALVEPPIRSSGPLRDISGVELAQYTVGVAGCGRQVTQIAVCAVDGTGCLSLSGRP
jgi:hypothetical protein